MSRNKKDYTKPKFDINKCANCKYHGTQAGYSNKSVTVPVFCNYAGIKDRTCLTVKNGKTIDRRGEDRDNCKLYEPGKPARTDMRII